MEMDMMDTEGLFVLACAGGLSNEPEKGCLDWTEKNSKVH